MAFVSGRRVKDLGVGGHLVTLDPLIFVRGATGLSAVLAGLLEATIFNPLYWLGIVLAFGLAFWITRKSRTSVASGSH